MAWQKFLAAVVVLWVLATMPGCGAAVPKEGRMMLVATPGVRNYLEYGGHGLLMYDMDHGHQLVRRISTSGLDKDGKPDNVKGIAASAQTGKVYISTIGGMQCLDMATEKMVWEKKYPDGCDRMSITPDGQVIYAPSFEGKSWYVLDAMNGNVLKTIGDAPAGAHNTVMGKDVVYLAGLHSSTLAVADQKTRAISSTVGLFVNSIRPYVVNGKETLVYANVDDLLGFQIADLKSGRVLYHVEVPGFLKGPVKRHGCPSHGIGLTQDETEVWVCDSFNKRIHIFDNTVMPPVLKQSIPTNDEAGWITWSIDGTLAYPSTGEVIDVKTKKTVAMLKDENGKPVQSEKMVEVDFVNGRAVRAGDQFAMGKVR